MLEKMDAFFEKRLDGYDEHMRTNVDDEGQFYAFTAAQLPKCAGAMILDLGCGTGLELEEYFPLNPTAQITGIDLCRPMLEALEKKFPGKKLRLICASYFDETIEQEYQFARGRANAHADKAADGDAWARHLYCGANLRMLELEERTSEIETRISEIEISFSMLEVHSA